VSRDFASRPSKGGICRRCRSDLRVVQQPGTAYVGSGGHRLFGGESDGCVYCSNGECPYFTEPYQLDDSLNLGGLMSQAAGRMNALAGLSHALGPLMADGRNWN